MLKKLLFQPQSIKVPSKNADDFVLFPNLKGNVFFNNFFAEYHIKLTNEGSSRITYLELDMTSMLTVVKKSGNVLDHVLYSWYMARFFNSDLHC